MHSAQWNAFLLLLLPSFLHDDAGRRPPGQRVHGRRNGSPVPGVSCGVPPPHAPLAVEQGADLVEPAVAVVALHPELLRVLVVLLLDQVRLLDRALHCHDLIRVLRVAGLWAGTRREGGSEGGGARHSGQQWYPATAAFRTP